MKVHELKSILTVLAPNKRRGLGVFTLAEQTDLKPATLRKYLNKHQNYFVKIPNSQLYTINRHGDGKGDITQISAHYNARLNKQKRDQYLCLFAVFISLLSILITTNQ